MTRLVCILAALAVLSGCSRPTPADDAKTSDVKAQARTAWTRCLFELDKVEVIRGRNLDDLNLRGSVARNQFMMDCMSAAEATVTPELLLEMTSYAAKKERGPSDMNLNSGMRKLPGDE